VAQIIGEVLPKSINMFLLSLFINIYSGIFVLSRQDTDNATIRSQMMLDQLMLINAYLVNAYQNNK